MAWHGLIMGTAIGFAGAALLALVVAPPPRSVAQPSDLVAILPGRSGCPSSGAVRPLAGRSLPARAVALAFVRALAGGDVAVASSLSDRALAGDVRRLAAAARGSTARVVSPVVSAGPSSVQAQLAARCGLAVLPSIAVVDLDLSQHGRSQRVAALVIARPGRFLVFGLR
jgi:hypothetical protein